jgi:hypothetical protein
MLRQAQDTSLCGGGYRAQGYSNRSSDFGNSY